MMMMMMKISDDDDDEDAADDDSDDDDDGDDGLFFGGVAIIGSELWPTRPKAPIQKRVVRFVKTPGMYKERPGAPLGSSRRIPWQSHGRPAKAGRRGLRLDTQKVFHSIENA